MPTFVPLRTIVCCYAMSPTEVASALSNCGRRIGIHFNGVIVSNGQHDLSGVSSDWLVIRGSNSELDFSAYQEGVEALSLTDQNLPEVTLFINDTAFKKHHALDILRNLMPYRLPVAECVLPAMAGKADAYDNICYRSPWSTLPIYLSTFCFLLNRAAMSAIGNVLAHVDVHLGDKTIDLNDPAWGHGLQDAFRTYLRCHLTYSAISNTWYQLEEKRGDRLLICQKARAVYYEHRLSGDIGATGILFNIYPTPRKKWQFFLREQQAKLKRKLRLS